MIFSASIRIVKMKVLVFNNRQKLAVVLIAFVLVYILYLMWSTRPFQMTEIQSDGDTSLTYRGGKFVLDEEEIQIFSGALHYFRVVPRYWTDRLEKFRAAGLNTVETYIPWNLHEEIRGQFSFDGNLNLRSFIGIARDLGLNVILRPGPYICAEWDFGGLPSWLLSIPGMKVRSMHPEYTKAVDVYLKRFFAEINDLQYSNQNGGPIIAFQVENEYGSYGNDLSYLTWLKERMIFHGARELLFTSDNSKDAMDRGSLPNTLITANFKKTKKAKKLKAHLQSFQPEAPFFVMELWAGWFDHWGETHNTWGGDEFQEVVAYLLNHGASINFYMMHGGTNFGFMNGANYPHEHTISSYDYDAPISENGELTEKYFTIQKLLTEKIPGKDRKLPTNLPTHNYGKVTMETMMPYSRLLSMTRPITMQQPVSMEMLDMNNGGGQGYGFVLYRCNISTSGVLKFHGGIEDMAWVIVNTDTTVEILDWNSESLSVPVTGVNTMTSVDVLVENMGRVNYAQYDTDQLNIQHKGLWGKVSLNDKPLSDWSVYPLEMRKDFLKRLSGMTRLWENAQIVNTPTLYRGTLLVDATPEDTFLKLPGWTKGVAFINGFNLGRYWSKGPQRSLYIPAPLLKKGKNEIVVFELIQPAKRVEFSDRPNLGATTE